MEKKPEVYYTVKDLARELKFSEKTIRNKLSEGEIKKTKVFGSVRIKKSDVDAYLESRNKDDGKK